MATFINGESGSSVRTKINNVLQHADGTAGTLVINDAGADVDFRIESDTNANAFFLDGATGNIGIGTASPNARLDVDAGNMRFADGWGPVWGASPNQPYISGSKASNFLIFGVNGSERMRIDASGNLGLGRTAPAARLDVRANTENSLQARFGLTNTRGLEISTALVSGTNDAGSVLDARGSGSGTMIFQTDSSERMRITSSGNVLIGTNTSGASRLRISGLPTSSAGLSAGDVWNDGGTLKIA